MAAQDTHLDCTLWFTFIRRNKTSQLVKSETAEIWTKAGLSGENQRTCLKSALLMWPKMFLIWTYPERTTEHRKDSKHCTYTLRHPSCQSRKKINVQTKKKKLLSKVHFYFYKQNSFKHTFTTKYHLSCINTRQTSP